MRRDWPKLMSAPAYRAGGSTVNYAAKCAGASSSAQPWRRFSLCQRSPLDTSAAPARSRSGSNNGSTSCPAAAASAPRRRLAARESPRPPSLAPRSWPPVVLSAAISSTRSKVHTLMRATAPTLPGRYVLPLVLATRIAAAHWQHVVRARLLRARAPAQALARTSRRHRAGASATSSLAARRRSRSVAQELVTGLANPRRTARQRPGRPRGLKPPRRPKPPLHRLAKATHLRLKAEAARASDISAPDESRDETRSAIKLDARVAAAGRPGSLQGVRQRDGTVAGLSGRRPRRQVPRLFMPHAVRRKRAS